MYWLIPYVAVALLGFAVGWIRGARSMRIHMLELRGQQLASLLSGAVLPTDNGEKGASDGE